MGTARFRRLAGASGWKSRAHHCGVGCDVTMVYLRTREPHRESPGLVQQTQRRQRHQQRALGPRVFGQLRQPPWPGPARGQRSHRRHLVCFFFPPPLALSPFRPRVSFLCLLSTRCSCRRRAASPLLRKRGRVPRGRPRRLVSSAAALAAGSVRKTQRREQGSSGRLWR